MCWKEEEGGVVRWVVAVAVGACVVDGGACVRLCEGARCACWRVR